MLSQSSEIQEVFIMFRLWGKIWKSNHMLRDVMITDSSNDTRTHKVMNGLRQICYDFDLSNPIWLDSNIRQFKQSAKARFYQDNFVETIDFDYLEIQIVEED